ncbi:MAG TPA: hypothetical protein VMX54_07630 [Vicinamibacteria bacterium]|nr:hypothetical protein [Vicinamibacteria bacterium]
MPGHGIPIWFFIGALLALYGVLILGAGLYGLVHPPAVELASLHVGVWWGALLLVIGVVYVVKYRPRRED